VKFEARIKELVETLPDWLCWSNRCCRPAGASRAVRHPASPFAAIVGTMSVPAPDNDPRCRPRGALTYRANRRLPARSANPSQSVRCLANVRQVSIREWIWDGRISRCEMR